MKKTLIALAALAATGAFAQSTVTIDGIMDAGYQQSNTKGVNVGDVLGNGSATSQINFRGTEDLGGGMKATFRVESDWNSTTNNAVPNNGVTAAAGAGTAVSTFGNGEIRVGLSGGFGAVDLGRVNFATLGIAGMGTPFGYTNFGNGYGSFTGGFVSVSDTGATTDTSGNNVRRNNSVMYTSPDLAGFKVMLYNVQKVDVGAAASDHRGASEIAATYTVGRLNVGVARISESAATAVAGSAAYNSTTTTIAGNYDLGNGFTIYALNQRAQRSDDSLDRTSTILGGKYVTGAHTVSLALGSGKDGGNRTSTGIGQTSNLASLGYDYNLSKRTAVYVRYENINDDGNLLGGNVAGGDVKRTKTALGLRHAF